MITRLSPQKYITKSLSPDSITPIWTKTTIEAGTTNRHLANWARSAYEQVVSRIRDPHFPCFYATAAEKHGYLRYAFAYSTTRDCDLAHIETAIHSYMAEIAQLPKEVADMTVLILLIRPLGIPLPLTVYEAIAWDFLSRLHNRDTVPWPLSLPLSPAYPQWSYALEGTPLFVNVSTPSNISRRSRNLGSALAIVVQPREAFDRVAGPTASGEKIRKTIRERCYPYDGIPAHPALTAYGNGASAGEACQYLLPDSNDTNFQFTWMNTEEIDD